MRDKAGRLINEVDGHHKKLVGHNADFFGFLEDGKHHLSEKSDMSEEELADDIINDKE